MRKEHWFFVGVVLALAIFFISDTSFATTAGVVNQATSTWWTEVKQSLQGNIGRLLAVAALGGGLYMLYRGAWQWGLVGLFIAYMIYNIPQTAETTYTLTF